MAKQIVIIHGGDAFSSYEEYLHHLRAIEINLSDVGRHGWKSTLLGELGDDYELLPLRMPNANNATYLEWSIWLQKYVPFLRDGVILLGHSLGGIFLAKYLAENRMSVRVAGTLLVAAPFDTDNEAGGLGDFTLPESLALLNEQGGAVHLFHSTDDTVVPISEMGKYKAQLPNATEHTFIDRGHFTGETFPELIAVLRTL